MASIRWLIATLAALGLSSTNFVAESWAKDKVAVASRSNSAHPAATLELISTALVNGENFFDLGSPSTDVVYGLSGYGRLIRWNAATGELTDVLLSQPDQYRAAALVPSQAKAALIEVSDRRKDKLSLVEWSTMRDEPRLKKTREFAHDAFTQIGVGSERAIAFGSLASMYVPNGARGLDRIETNACICALDPAGKCFAWGVGGVSLIRNDGDRRQMTVINGGGLLHSLRFSPSGRYLAIGTAGVSESELSVWDTKTWSVSYKAMSGGTCVYDCEFFPDEGVVAVLNDEGGISRHSISRKVRVEQLAVCPDSSEIAISPEGEQLFVADKVHIRMFRLRPNIR